MSELSRTGRQALAILAVDNIQLSKAGLNLFSAVDRGDMSIEEAKDSVRARARAYGASSSASSLLRRKKR